LAMVAAVKSAEPISAEVAHRRFAPSELMWPHCAWRSASVVEPPTKRLPV